MSLRRFLSSLAVFAFAMAAIFGAIQPSFADDDEDNEPNFMSKLFGAVGLLQLPGPVIDYQERAPLVVPPISPYVQPVVSAPLPQNTNAPQNPWDFSAAPAQNIEGSQQEDQRPPRNALTLPPPVDPNSARVRNPDFPIDPEVKAALKRQKNKTKIFNNAEDNPVYSGRRLTPAEMKNRGAVAANGKGNRNSLDPNAAQSTAQELQIPSIAKMIPMIGREQHDKPIEFTGEPERQTLTQPPSGYLTPSRNAPYGVVAKDKQGRDTTRLVHPNMPEYSGPMPTQ